MIKIDNLSFSYSKHPFIENMSFEVKSGEIFGFLGPSGAGKSTLQKLMIGLISNYEGSLKIDDIEVKNHKNNFYENIGVDFEFSTLYEKMTGQENLEFFASLYKAKERSIYELLESVELLNDADKKVSAYSKGMKSRLNFIKAIMHDPKYIFLDEPTNGLDPNTSQIIGELILKEKQKGKTIIITTHNMEDASQLCDRVAFIVKGKIKALDSPHNLIMEQGASTIKYSYLENGKELNSTSNLLNIKNDLSLIKIIKENRLLTIHSSEPNLGDIFKKVTGRELV